MPRNALLRRLGIDRPSVIERATEAADSGFWLALRVSAGVTIEELRELLDLWGGADLAPITDVVVPPGFPEADSFADEPFAWLSEVDSLAVGRQLNPVIPAAAKGAEALCRELRAQVVALDEAVPDSFRDPCFSSRPERDKSFVRCAKGLLTGTADGRLERLVLWSTTHKVVGACRTAAHNTGASGHYEFCLPELEVGMADRLLSEGETVRLWFAVDRTTIERVVGR